MRKADKRKLLLVMGISLIFSLAGCVDTSVNPIPPNVVYHSQVSFVNLVEGGGAATISMVDYSGATSFSGNLALGVGSSFKEVQAGNKTLNVNFATAPNQTYKFALSTDYKYRIFIAGSDTVNNVYRIAQRYIWQTKDSKDGASLFPADTGWISFFNGAPNGTIDKVVLSGTYDTTITLNLSSGSYKGYVKLKAGSYDFATDYTYTYAVNDSTTADSTFTVTFNQTLGSKGKYTAGYYNSGPSLQYKVYTDD